MSEDVWLVGPRLCMINHGLCMHWPAFLMVVSRRSAVHHDGDISIYSIC